ncbi:hypothetical protein, partial [Salmonella sp. s51884]|uniref:hypothetical protein n=1 Tax=Salmonella sp. s51884 TaxID=3159654 RepID=UPI003980C443
MSFFIPEATLMIFFFYLIKKTAILLICHKNSLYFLSSLKKRNVIPTTIIIFSISLLSLGGLPPLGGFINKIVPLFIFSFKKRNLIIPFFLIGRLLSLFFYIRIVFKTRLTLFPQNRIKTLIFRKG